MPALIEMQRRHHRYPHLDEHQEMDRRLFWAVFAILDARWQSQSAKPAASQRGSTKYINT
jgi:hypothetical protein